jgi:hypothetical protein
MLPELVFLLSPNMEKMRRVPGGVNLACGIAAALMAYGVRG